MSKSMNTGDWAGLKPESIKPRIETKIWLSETSLID